MASNFSLRYVVFIGKPEQFLDFGQGCMYIYGKTYKTYVYSEEWIASNNCVLGLFGKLSNKKSRLTLDNYWVPDEEGFTNVLDRKYFVSPEEYIIMKRQEAIDMIL
jgi:hypothetical protein